MLRITINKAQSKGFSEFFIDLAKLIFASAVLGFFIPGLGGDIGIWHFIIGIIASFLFLLIGIYFLKKYE